MDVGCGGGLLAEALFDAGAEVSAIDVTERNIEVAKHHANAHKKYFTPSHRCEKFFK